MCAGVAVATGDVSKAEWALALWAVDSGPVLDALLQQREQSLQELSTDRRSVVLRSAAQIGQYGWLQQRPITASSSDAVVARLIKSRDPTTGKRGLPIQQAHVVGASVATQASLLSTARAAKWLKVDSVAAYR